MTEKISTEMSVEMDEDVTLDDLPDLALVKIFNDLNLMDKYHLSLVNKRMHSMFYHPHLWSKMELHLHTYTTSEDPEDVYTELPNKYVKIIEQFGNYFQHLTLRVTGKMVHKLDEEAEQILEKLASICRLETLTIEVGQIITHHYVEDAPIDDIEDTYDLGAIEKFVHDAYRLKSLNIKSWPIFSQHILDEDNPANDIFTALLDNTRLKFDIESIGLFWVDSNTWSVRNPVLPSPESTNTLINHFQSLTCLRLRSPMVSEALIRTLSLSRRHKLKQFRIFVQHHDDLDELEIPEISSRAWEKFRSHNLTVFLECKIMSRCKFEDLACFLKPECPLKSVIFMKYSQVDGEMLNSLARLFSTTLKNFACYCDPTASCDEFVAFAKACVNLFKITLNGGTESTTLVDLAELKTSEWKKFDYNEKAIKYIDTEKEDLPPDTVIAKDEDGELYQVSLMRHHVDEDRVAELKIQTLDRIRMALTGLIDTDDLE